jgi:hypothetical protein
MEYGFEFREMNKHSTTLTTLQSFLQYIAFQIESCFVFLCLIWPQIMIFLTNALHIAGTIGVNHHTYLICGNGFSVSFCLSWHPTLIFPIFTSQVAGIEGMSITPNLIYLFIQYLSSMYCASFP